MFKNDTIVRKDNVITAHELFSFGRQEYDIVELPELGGVVYLRQLSAREVMGFGDLQRDGITSIERVAAQNSMIARALVNQNGARIVAPEDEDKLADIPLKLYIKILNAITEGLSDVSAVDVVAARTERDSELVGGGEAGS